MAAKNVKETTVYKKGFELAMEIFRISKSFPPEEKYSLTDQIRRSSRSICICLLEAYRKKKYAAHFYLKKLRIVNMENSETSGWLDFAFACLYISKEQHSCLTGENEEVGKLLNYMINNPEKY